MKKIYVLILSVTLLSAEDDSRQVPTLYVVEEDGLSNKIYIGPDHITEKTFKKALEQGLWAQCGLFLSGRTETEIAAYKTKYGNQQIDRIMGSLAYADKEGLSVEELVTAQKAYQQNPLHFLTFFGALDLVQKFLQDHPKYNVSTTTVTGKTAEDIAREEQYGSLEELLKGAKSRGSKHIITVQDEQNYFECILVLLLKMCMLLRF